MFRKMQSKYTIFSTVLSKIGAPSVEDVFYHFSDEEEGEDALLARAFVRWEQLGGGSTQAQRLSCLGGVYGQWEPWFTFIFHDWKLCRVYFPPLRKLLEEYIL